MKGGERMMTIMEDISNNRTDSGMTNMAVAEGSSFDDYCSEEDAMDGFRQQPATIEYANRKLQSAKDIELGNCKSVHSDEEEEESSRDSASDHTADFLNHEPRVGTFAWNVATRGKCTRNTGPKKQVRFAQADSNDVQEVAPWTSFDDDGFTMTTENVFTSSPMLNEHGDELSTNSRQSSVSSEQSSGILSDGLIEWMPASQIKYRVNIVKVPNRAAKGASLASGDHLISSEPTLPQENGSMTRVEILGLASYDSSENEKESQAWTDGTTRSETRHEDGVSPDMDNAWCSCGELHRCMGFFTVNSLLYVAAICSCIGFMGVVVALVFYLISDDDALPQEVTHNN
eukprot:scaffold7012_cov157-Amphora_coffeaeformis.AAC.18